MLTLSQILAISEIKEQEDYSTASREFQPPVHILEERCDDKDSEYDEQEREFIGYRRNLL